jgi:hypothetical protein
MRAEAPACRSGTPKAHATRIYLIAYAEQPLVMQLPTNKTRRDLGGVQESTHDMWLGACIHAAKITSFHDGLLSPVDRTGSIQLAEHLPSAAMHAATPTPRCSRSRVCRGARGVQRRRLPRHRVAARAHCVSLRVCVVQVASLCSNVAGRMQVARSAQEACSSTQHRAPVLFFHGQGCSADLTWSPARSASARGCRSGLRVRVV